MTKVKKLIRFAVFALFFMAVCYVGVYLYAWISPKLIIEKANKLYFYDQDKRLFSGSSDKDWVSLSNISEHLINATISIEDKNFYKHHGFDYPRIAKSLYINFINKKTLQGASTISQQYAKNLFLDFGKTWRRKAEEAWLTLRLETHYTKDEILEGYLNTINYGGVFGIENASNYYFSKSAKDLTLAEATILAGIPKSPTYYSPITNEENAKERQTIILNSMVKNKYISQNDLEKTLNEELVYVGIEETDKLTTLMYYQDAVIEELRNIKTIPPSFLKTGGLKIYTNLDVKAQKIMDDSIKKNMPKSPDLQIASIAMEPITGKVLALAGGVDYSKSQFNRATSSKRQVGSTMKPLLYYAALENGFTASTSFISEKTTFVFAENKTYSPSNFADIYGNRPISMAAALTYSDNIYAVKTHLFLGEENLVDIASRVGIESELSPIPSLALGSEEINIMEMMQAYGSFANEGYKIKPYFIDRIEDINGNTIYKHQEVRENILNKSIVFILNEMMSNCYAGEFIDYSYPTCFSIGPRISKKYAIKTGSTDTDHIIMGFNKDLVVGVWTGYDDNRTSDGANNIYSKYVWIDVMEKYLEDRGDSWYEMPKNVVGVFVDPISGELANMDTKKKKIFYYIKGTEPYDKNPDLEDLIPTVKEE
ncbi:MAG: transglycosylase domain-containing protein [Bacilli bacterium]|nr:transglycosylase domain-containing protein [Bacilli bacterium]MDD4282417.1 transglycosylase domain-containing protein [Bacilli bacterium]